MSKKELLKKWLKWPWKTRNITVFALIVAITLPIISNHRETNRKRDLVYVENVYNIGLVNTYKKAIENDELDKKLFFNRFSVEIYRNNWDIISNLEPVCAENLIRAIAEMDAINSINQSILTLYNQEGLIFTVNQRKNTEERMAHWYTTLEENLSELNLYLDNLDGCKF